jgi:hypothetical protein
MVRSKIKEASAIRIVNVFVYLLCLTVLVVLAFLYVSTCI